MRYSSSAIIIQQLLLLLNVMGTQLIIPNSYTKFQHMLVTMKSHVKLQSCYGNVFCFGKIPCLVNLLN